MASSSAVSTSSKGLEETTLNRCILICIVAIFRFSCVLALAHRQSRADQNRNRISKIIWRGSKVSKL